VWVSGGKSINMYLQTAKFTTSAEGRKLRMSGQYPYCVSRLNLSQTKTEFQVVFRLKVSESICFVSEPVLVINLNLTSWSRVLSEKLTVPQLLKKFPAFYVTRRFITALTRARHVLMDQEDHPLSAVCNCFFNIFAATLLIWKPFLHPQPQDAPCRCDRDPLVTGAGTYDRSFCLNSVGMFCFVFLEHRLWRAKCKPVVRLSDCPSIRAFRFAYLDSYHVCHTFRRFLRSTDTTQYTRSLHQSRPCTADRASPCLRYALRVD
jgi:hypothetical protein